jgi:outer membrane lipoprotein-sorting protein
MRLWPGLLACCLFALWAGPGRADDADAAPVVAKAVKAMGGEEKLAKLQTGSWKGKATVQEGGQDVTVVQEGTWQGLTRFRMDLDIQANGNNSKVLVVLNGDKAWVKGGEQVQDVPKEVLPFAFDLFYALRAPHLLAGLKDKAFQLAPLGEVKVDDKPAVGVRVTHKDRKELRLWFDKATGLPLKSEVSLTDPGGKNITVETIYSDYKDFDGIKHPAKVLVKADGKEVTLEVSEVKAEEGLDENTFAKPT